MIKPDLRDYEMWDTMLSISGLENLEDYCLELHDMGEMLLRDELIDWLRAKGLVREGLS